MKTNYLKKRKTKKKTEKNEEITNKKPILDQRIVFFPLRIVFVLQLCFLKGPGVDKILEMTPQRP